MSSDKLIVVLGATGNQGGSVVETFLSEPGWRVRGITRNTTSPKAQALASRGVEVVEASMDVTDTLSSAFKDANTIFSVSNFWEGYFNPANASKVKPGQALNAWAAENESQQLKNVIDAAAKVPTLERFIFSAISNASKWSKGKYTHIYHFDGKANAEEYGKEKYPELWKKTSIFQAGIYLSNYVSDPAGAPTKVCANHHSSNDNSINREIGSRRGGRVCLEPQS